MARIARRNGSLSSGQASMTFCKSGQAGEIGALIGASESVFPRQSAVFGRFETCALTIPQKQPLMTRQASGVTPAHQPQATAPVSPSRQRSEERGTASPTRASRLDKPRADMAQGLQNRNPASITRFWPDTLIQPENGFTT